MNKLIAYKPEILIGLGLGSLIGSSVLNILGTANAVKLIDAEKEKTGKDKLTAKETIKVAWKCYIPGAVALGVGIPCIIASNAINVKNNAAIAAAYAVTQTTLNNFRQETSKLIGDEKTKEIEHNVAQAAVNSNPPTVIYADNDGKSLYLESYSGRYFVSDWNTIQAAALRLNGRALDGENVITLTDWYNELGIDKTAASDVMGWDVYSNGSKGLIDITQESCVYNNKPCGVISYNVWPHKVY